jgi:hypothetical protein
MADQFLTLKGFDAFVAKMRELPKALARKHLRPALLAGAYVVQKAALQEVPVLSASKVPTYKGKPIRTPGLLRSKLKVRTSKEATREGNVGVFVNIQPAKPGERGKYSPLDPFYFRWVTFKTKRNNGKAPGYRPFLQAGARKLEGDALAAVTADLGPRIQALNDGGAL